MNTEPQLLARIVNFLNSIHISVVEKSLPTDTFLPGLRIEGGTIFMDLEQLKYPGDLLHEAVGTKRTLNGSLNNSVVKIIWAYRF